MAAEFVEFGHELIDQLDYRTSYLAVPVRCLGCGVRSTKWLSNLRRGHGCESCYAPTRAAIGDQSRFSQADAEAIVVSIGLTPTGAYVNALTPCPCRCGRCGRDVGPRLGDITAKLRAGKQVFGCEPCAHLQVGIDSRTSEAEIRDDLLAAGVEYLDGYVTPRPQFAVDASPASAS
ncbi:DNA-directed RNA polymerase subunit N (RpoN/RPB10) [Actinoplanes tereljensis]|uniref:Uncharacterized protein n=1 Tax=Paractinoplanes tereljensis TaxID=571912 RepID=A0A919NI95_9ACTN|nr:hypothetical protein [Actinoplanes tereljensis]GIF18968.1 hypothetical protein Ate02nite_16980 [Actinoplanes tereljensis]